MFTVSAGAPLITFAGLTFSNLGAGLQVGHNGAECNRELDFGQAGPPAAVVVAGGELIVQECQFVNNAVSALHLRAGRIEVHTSDFLANGGEHVMSGGAMQVCGGELHVSGCTLQANTARFGGAAYVYGAQRCHFENTSFINNTAQTGGALFVREGSVTLGNETLLEHNHANGTGQTLYIESSAEVTYALPAPAGHWIANPTSCAAYSTNASQSGCRSSDHWGRTIWTLARAPFDDVLPFRCTHGLVGSSPEAIAEQSSPICGGACPPGSFCLAGTRDPSPCARGKWCPAGTPAEVPCEAGTYNPVRGASNIGACHECIAGFWCGVGTSSPIPCPRNSTSTSLGANVPEACIPCPPNAFTTGTNSTRKDQCKCLPNFYSTDPLDDWECAPCGTGMVCNESGSTLRTLNVRLGYYRLSPTSRHVRRCSDSAAGCNDESACAKGTSGCAGGIGSGEQLCRPTLTGPFCQLCRMARADVSPTVFNETNVSTEANVSTRMFYVPATHTEAAHCEPCSSSHGYFAMVLVPCVVSIAVLLWSVIGCVLRRSDRLRLARNSLISSLHAYSLPTKLKLLVSFYQISTRVEHVYEATLTDAARAVLNAVRFVISLGIDGIPLQCFGVDGYLSTLVFWMSVPLFLSGAAVCYEVLHAWCGGRCSRSEPLLRELQSRGLPHVLFIFFLTYPIVTNHAFDAFSCVEFDDGSRFLIADVSTMCESDEHEYSKFVAWIAISIYPIGVVMITSLLLWGVRKDIGADSSTPLAKATRFLHADYTTILFWWEVPELIRRFLLVGLFVALPSPFERGTIMQLALASLVSTGYGAVQFTARPYRTLSDNLVALVSSTCLTTLFLVCIFFKVGSFTDGIGTLNPEQRADFLIHTLLLGVVALSSVIAAIIVAAIILIVQFAEDQRRRQHEARANLARRLRYKHNNDEVTLGKPIISEGAAPDFAPSKVMGDVSGQFHIFLSHVWGTGQDQMRIVKQRLREMTPDASVFLDVDDLKDGKGAEYVDVSVVVLIFASRGYFQSPNCMREILRAVVKRKPILAMLEPEREKGGLTQDEIFREVHEADTTCEKAGKWYSSKYVLWGLDAEVKDWGYHMPDGSDICNEVFESDPIEWNRIGAFQDVTMRLVAHRLLMCNVPDFHGSQNRSCSRRLSSFMLRSHGSRRQSRRSSSDSFGSVLANMSNESGKDLFGRLQNRQGSLSSKSRRNSQSGRRQSSDRRCTSPRRSIGSPVFDTWGGQFGGVLSGEVVVQGERTSQSVVTTTPMRSFHVYCSRHNYGAKELMSELATYLDIDVSTSAAADKTASTKTALHVASSLEHLSVCDHMLIYLTEQTWTRSESTVEQFVSEVKGAMDAGVHLLLAHEMLGLGQEDRFPCAFGDFFGCTPRDLLLRGIYNSIATALKGNAWRGVSMALLGSSLFQDAGESTTAKSTGAGNLERRLQRLRVLCRSAIRRGSGDVKGSSDGEGSSAGEGSSTGAASHRLSFGLQNRRGSERGIAVAITPVSVTHVSVDVQDTEEAQADAAADEEEQKLERRMSEDIMDDLKMLQRRQSGEEVTQSTANADTVKRMRRAVAAGDTSNARRLYGLIKPGEGGAKDVRRGPDHSACRGEASDKGDAGVGSGPAGDGAGDGESSEGGEGGDATSDLGV